MKVSPIDTSDRIIHVVGDGTNVKCQDIHRATAIPATAKSPAATEPMFFVAAPVKPADPIDPVFEGATGTIGDPVAAAPEPVPAPKPEPKPELELTLAPGVPVAIGAVPVANPVDPATTVELGEVSTNLRRRRLSVKKGKAMVMKDSYLIALVLVHEQMVSKYVEVYTIG